MEKRVGQQKTFGFTREIKSTSASKIDANVNRSQDDDDDGVSILSVDDHSPVHSSSQKNHQFKKISSVHMKTKSSIGLNKGLFVLIGILIIISVIITAPTVLGVVLSRNPAVTGKTSSTTIAPNVTNAQWNFDGNGNDMYGVYNGVLQNGAQYSNTTYFGTGSSLQINGILNESFTISLPFLNLSYTSFTVEAWIYAYTLNGDNPIFTQCACSTCQDQCLYLLVRNFKLYMGFMIDDVIGLTSLTINTWYHVGFVYDYSSQTQSVYLQGVLDNSKSSAGPYKGGNATIEIGSLFAFGSSFNGFIDSAKVTTRAKSADEMLTAGTTVVYFSFDGSTLSENMGPNKMNGTISNAAAATGKVGKGLIFSGSTSSYLQIPGFQQMGLSNRPVTISLWVYPYSINGGVLIQRQPFLNTTGNCYSLMGLNYFGQISMIILVSGAPLIVGPVLALRTWTHLGYTYSLSNGLRMYVNGAYIGTTGPQSWWSTGQIDYLLVGAYPYGYCGQSAFTINVVPFQGAIDELYVYRRELSASEILALANP